MVYACSCRLPNSYNTSTDSAYGDGDDESDKTDESDDDDDDDDRVRVKAPYSMLNESTVLFLFYHGKSAGRPSGGERQHVANNICVVTAPHKKRHLFAFKNPSPLQRFE